MSEKITTSQDILLADLDEIEKLRSQRDELADLLSRATLVIALLGGNTGEFHAALAKIEGSKT